MGTSPHPEAAPLRRARQARGLSIPAAAEAAGISQQRWAQIERSEGKKAAPPDTVARMAHAVGITSERLAEYRPDAAEILEEIELQAAAGTDAFEGKLRKMIADLPANERSIVEELFAEHISAQERNLQMMEKLVDLFSHRKQQKASDNGEAEGRSTGTARS